MALEELFFSGADKGVTLLCMRSGGGKMRNSWCDEKEGKKAKHVAKT